MRSVKTSDHNFVLMVDSGLTKEYLCSSCRAKATLIIHPREPLCYVSEKFNGFSVAGCHKGVFNAINEIKRDKEDGV